jgi:hypothetical protein
LKAANVTSQVLRAAAAACSIASVAIPSGAQQGPAWIIVAMRETLTGAANVIDELSVVDDERPARQRERALADKIAYALERALASVPDVLDAEAERMGVGFATAVVVVRRWFGGR